MTTRTEERDDVGDYVRDLEGRLQGPWRARAGLMREVRDGLRDAVVALVANGVPERDAARLAVAEFGPAAELAPEFQRELAVLQARRTAAWAALSLPALWLAWDLMWRTSPDLHLAPAPIMMLARLTDVIGLGTALLCLGALVVMELGGGRLRRPERLARAVGRTTLCGVLGVLATSATMTGMNLRETVAATQASPMRVTVSVVTMLAASLVVRSGVRCGRAARLSGGAPAHD